MKFFASVEGVIRQQNYPSNMHKSVGKYKSDRYFGILETNPTILNRTNVNPTESAQIRGTKNKSNGWQHKPNGKFRQVCTVIW